MAPYRFSLILLTGVTFASCVFGIGQPVISIVPELAPQALPSLRTTVTLDLAQTSAQKESAQTKEAPKKRDLRKAFAKLPKGMILLGGGAFIIAIGGISVLLRLLNSDEDFAELEQINAVPEETSDITLGKTPSHSHPEPTPPTLTPVTWAIPAQEQRQPDLQIQPQPDVQPPEDPQTVVAPQFTAANPPRQPSPPHGHQATADNGFKETSLPESEAASLSPEAPASEITLPEQRPTPQLPDLPVQPPQTPIHHTPVQAQQMPPLQTKAPPQPASQFSQTPPPQAPPHQTPPADVNRSQELLLTPIGSRHDAVDRIEQLILSLQSSDPTVRSKVIWELGQQADSRAIQPLVDLLINSDSKQRSLILAALSEIGTRALKPMNRALTFSLQDENAEVRKNAIRDITRIYDLILQMTQLVQRAVYDPDPEVQATAEWAIDKLSRIRPLPSPIDRQGNRE
ncbi:MAG: HEAT repeat domain-containing protein [Microcoleaceae cyanobacterium]